MKQSGVSFAYVKATQGTDYINPDALQQVSLLREAGIKVGLYHFLDTTPNTATAQAQYFLITAASLGGSDLPVALDSETTDSRGWNDLAAMMVAFAMQVEQEPSQVRNTNSVFYVNLNFYDNLPGFPWGRGIWLANPGVSAPSKSCLIWQSGGRPIGNLGTVDWDQFVGSEAQWLVFTGGPTSPVSTSTGTTPTPPSTPTPTEEFDLSNMPNVLVGTPVSANVVKTLQCVLRDKFNQTALGVNGNYGTETIQAVKNLQNLLKLPATGEVNAALWEFMLLD